MNRTVTHYAIGLLFSLLPLLTATSSWSDQNEGIVTIENIQFVRIASGKFDMGDIKKKDILAVPAHKVTISDFYIGKYEVTFDQYDRFCEATGRKKPDDMGWGRGNQPVINVSWDDAMAYAAWLTKISSRIFRLPSESEWEYAARSGRSTAYWWGADPVKGTANCSDCGTEWDNKRPTLVGTFEANPWGLHDMTGNVYEWCLDLRNDNYVGAPADSSPWLTGDQAWRITRGGSWKQQSAEMRYFARSWDRISNKYSDVGFRLVLEP